MYLMEWAAWRKASGSVEVRAMGDEVAKEDPLLRPIKLTQADLDEQPMLDESMSGTPQTRGPIYSFSHLAMDMRCGALEERRGLLTIPSLFLLFFIVYAFPSLWMPAFYALATGGEFFIGSPNQRAPGAADAVVATCFLGINVLMGWPYFKYGFRFTRLELFTQRRLLIRFNRVTRQVHLHRPKSCGGVVTLPWEATRPVIERDWAPHEGHGLRLGLAWHPLDTGLPYIEMAFVGKRANNSQELLDEWEFIRRYMEEGADAVPRPWCDTRLPAPWQSFLPQFEGMRYFFRLRQPPVVWLGKVLMSPAFVVIGTMHWISQLLCWWPRWPRVIRQAGRPGKPIPTLTVPEDYPPRVCERLYANADQVLTREQIEAMFPGKPHAYATAASDEAAMRDAA